jgi:hypothetical protein
MSVEAATRTPIAEAFADALAARPEEVRHGRAWLGGYSTVLRVVGHELYESLARTLAPAPESEPAELRIDLWDAAVTGSPVPDGPPLHGWRQDIAGGPLIRSGDGRWLAHHHPDIDLWVDIAQGRLVGGVRTRRESIGWHPARPLQTIFIYWLAGLRRAVLHAAMVMVDGRGALVAGPSGQGKSTTAAASVAAGLGVLGDDTVALQRTDEGWIGHCMYATVKTRTGAARLAPDLARAAIPLAGRWAGESVLYLNEVRPESIVPSAKLTAILLPKLCDRVVTEVEPIRAGAALAVLTGTALSLQPGEVAAGFEQVSAVAEHVPAFRLHVGRDPSTVPGAIVELLARLDGS